MDFLVQIQVNLPPGIDATERARLVDTEAIRGRELKEQGAIVNIWRIPGRMANVGIWSAPDATVLHDALTSLPMFPYIDAQVTALAKHHLGT
jgi:muconolactone D-isomerase